jgi:hypothetical protein
MLNPDFPIRRLEFSGKRIRDFDGEDALYTCFVNPATISPSSVLSDTFEDSPHDRLLDISYLDRAHYSNLQRACLNENATITIKLLGSLSILTRLVILSIASEQIARLRWRMIEDMTIRKLAPKTQHDYVQRGKNFAAFLGRSPIRRVLRTCAATSCIWAASGVAVLCRHLHACEQKIKSA